MAGPDIKHIRSIIGNHRQAFRPVISNGIIVFIFVVVNLSGSFSEAKMEGTHMSERISGVEINEAIELTTDKAQQQFLMNFKVMFEGESRITVTEQEGDYEIIVSRPDRSAEQYFLDKKTGTRTMGWHDSPMENPSLRDDKAEDDSLIVDPNPK